MLANQMRAAPANYELTSAVPANYVHGHVQIHCHYVLLESPNCYSDNHMVSGSLVRGSTLSCKTEVWCWQAQFSF